MQLLILLLAAMLSCGDGSPRLTFSQSMFLQLVMADYKEGNSPEFAGDILNEIRMKRELLKDLNIELIDSTDARAEYNQLVKCLVETVRDGDPEYYRLLAYRSAVEELKFKSNLSRNPADLFLFGDAKARARLLMTEKQSASFEKLTAKVSTALDKARKEFELEVREILKERYHAILAELDEIEREFIEANYGEPAILSDAYEFGDPLNDLYHFRGMSSDCSKTFRAIWDDFYKAEPIQPQYSPEHVSDMVIRLIYSDLLDFDESQISDIAEALKTGNGAKYTEYDAHHKRQRQLDLVKKDFEYPKAFRDALSDSQLLRLKQVEYQFLRRSIGDFGMLPDESRPSMILTRVSAGIVEQQLKLQEEQLNSVFRSQLEKTADLLREAYKTSEELLTEEQREVALPQSKSLKGDIVFLLTGVKSKQERN